MHGRPWWLSSVAQKKGCLDVALYVISGLAAHVGVGYTALGRLTMNSIDLTSADKAPPVFTPCAHKKIHITISVNMSQWLQHAGQWQEPAVLGEILGTR